MSVGEKIVKVIESIPKNVKLVAVSKTKTIEVIKDAYAVGQRVFGENKVQELITKHPALPKDIEWHMIGHLQSNKVKLIAPFISMIHAVDSFKLLKTINKEAEKNNRTISVLLQMHIAQESSKFGMDMKEITEILSSDDFDKLKNIKVEGLMGMATFTDDELIVRNEFKRLTLNFNKIKDSFFSNNDSFKEISMGMSGDYPLAIEEGSTMVRIGSSIFGARNILK